LASRPRGGRRRPPDGEPIERDDPSRIAARRVAAGLLIAGAGTIIYWAVPLPDLMSERRAYLPLVGAAIALSGLVGPLGSRLAAAPQEGEARFTRSRLRLDTGDLKGAAADLEEASVTIPARVIVWINLGIARTRLGDLRGAEEALRTALGIKPDEPRALANLA